MWSPSVTQGVILLSITKQNFTMPSLQNFEDLPVHIDLHKETPADQSKSLRDSADRCETQYAEKFQTWLMYYVNWHALCEPNVHFEVRGSNRWASLLLNCMPNMVGRRCWCDDGDVLKFGKNVNWPFCKEPPFFCCVVQWSNSPTPFWWHEANDS